MLQEVHHQTERVSTILHSLIHFSHYGHPETQSTQALSLFELVEESIKLMQFNQLTTPHSFHNRCSKTHLVVANQQKLVQVFINLFSNALDASSNGQPIVIESGFTPEDGAGTGTITITVSDQGIGVPETVIDMIFDPFFTTKQPGSGTGLGLSLVYRFIKDQQGTVSLQSPTQPDGTGTTVTLKLPGTDQAHLAEKESQVHATEHSI